MVFSFLLHYRAAAALEKKKRRGGTRRYHATKERASQDAKKQKKEGVLRSTPHLGGRRRGTLRREQTPRKKKTTTKNVVPTKPRKTCDVFCIKLICTLFEKALRGREAHTQRKRVKWSGIGRPARARRADGEDIQLRRWLRAEGRETNLQFIRDTHTLSPFVLSRAPRDGLLLLVRTQREVCL